MKQNLTKEESQKLLTLGVPKEKASEKEKIWGKDGSHMVYKDDAPIFTLTDLLELLPKEIEQDYCDDFCIKYCKGRYCAGYGFSEPYEGFGFEKFFTAEELIDCLYDLMCWCLENGYLKSGQSVKTPPDVNR